MMKGISKIRHVGSKFLGYLSSRQQFVVYNGQTSELKLIKCEIPQGSIPGPLLFCLYVSDLTYLFSFFIPILFADDCNNFCTEIELK